MKICEIWENVRNESWDIKDMVLASLEGQLNIRFKQIVDLEILKLGIKNEEVGDLVDYDIVVLLCEETWRSLGLDKNINLYMFRELIFAVDRVKVSTNDEYGNPSDCIYIEADIKQCIKSKTVRVLLSDIMHKVYISEFIDIRDTTLINLKNNR